MHILGIGVDLVETARIDHSLEKFGDRFLHRVFVEGEIQYCRSMKYPARHFAARFAAKEAVSKAFGTGIGRHMGWRDIEVCRHGNGEPYAILHGDCEAFARERRVAQVLISLSHTDHHAVANAVVVAHDPPD